MFICKKLEKEIVMLKRVVASIVGLIAIMLVIVIFNTLINTPPQEPAQPVQEPARTSSNDNATFVRKLSESIRFKTVSNGQDGAARNDAEFHGFIGWLQQSFPLAHNQLTRTMINELTPVYKWLGKKDSLPPILLTAHYDVVPVVNNDVIPWVKPPFSGDVHDGYIWGRGTIDNKLGVVGMMEAVEQLIAIGFQPQRTLYFSFGHDEEIGGPEGAAKVVEHFKSKGIQFEWSLDEGSFVLKDMLDAVKQPVTSINIAEKGMFTIELVARAVDGHSSMPPQELAVDILATALVKLVKNPMPYDLSGVTESFFKELAPHLSFQNRMVFSNLWLFEPLLVRQLAQSPPSNAMLRTTIAPTMLEASVKENVLPSSAKAVINFRIHPRDTTDTVLAHVKNVIDDDRIEISIRTRSEASAVSSDDSAAYHLLAATAKQVFDSTIVAPGLTIAGTDTKHYEKVSDDSYRILPVVITPSELPGIHGTNERISIDNAEHALNFYKLMIENIR